MEKTKQILAQITSYLDQKKAAAHDILNDQVVKQWDNVQIDKYTAVLTDLDVSPDDLYNASDNYQKTTKKLLKEVAHWENAKSNLTADIRLCGIQPEKAHSQALKLQDDCRQTQELHTKIADFHGVLLGTAQIIKENLSIKAIIPLTTVGQPNKKKNLITGGLAVLAMVTKNPELKSSTLNIHDLAEQATSIATKFSQLEFPDMPELAKVIIKGHVETCKTALEDANSFLLFCEHICTQELRNIDGFMENLENLKQQSFSEILASLNDRAQVLRGHIATFEHKSRTMKEVRKMTFMLSNLQNIYSAIRHSYLPYIAGQTMDQSAPLHPDIFAAAISRNYFKGIPGLIRMIRLFFATTKESGILNEIDLTDKISIALSTCPYYHAKGENNLGKMAQFIDKLISYYKKPFPYEDLTVILKNSIATYGAMIEKDFYKFKPDGLTIHDDEEEDEGATNKPLPIGRLLSKIEIQAHRFKALQPTK